MKRIDYFWPRIVFDITLVVFVTQLITEIFGHREHGFEWVIYASGAAFFAAIAYVFVVIFINTGVENGKD